MANIEKLNSAKHFSTPDGTWTITPVSDGGIRIQMCKGEMIKANLYTEDVSTTTMATDVFLGLCVDE